MKNLMIFFRKHVPRRGGVLTSSVFGQSHFDVQMSATTRARGRVLRQFPEKSVNR